MPVLVSAALAPVFLIGGWTLAAHRQPAGYDATRDTISALAGLGATDRWVMTAGLVGLGVCHMVTALGLRHAAVAGRVLLATGGLATLAVAVFPVPRTGSSSAHAVAALVAFGALTLWPVFARVPERASGVRNRASGVRNRAPGVPNRASRVPGTALAATVVLAALLAWFGLELFTDGARVGLSERVLAAAQALWPLCVVVLGKWSAREGGQAARNVRR